MRKDLFKKISCFGSLFFASFLLFNLFACHKRGNTLDNLKAPRAIVEAILGEGDVIEVRIFDEKELSGDYQVGSGGEIRLPLVGNLRVSNLTPEEVASKIAKSYERNYLKSAQVSVFVKEFNSRKIFVLGHVKKPGPYAYEENMTIIGAIARAAGTSQYASPNRTVITRDYAGGQKKMTARVADIGRGEAADIQLFPGDIIFVPESIF